jgi:protein-tyrosine kinase
MRKMGGGGDAPQPPDTTVPEPAVPTPERAVEAAALATTGATSASTATQVTSPAAPPPEVPLTPTTPAPTATATPPPPSGVARQTLELDFERLRRLGFMLPGDPASRLSEEFQQIKRRLIGNTVPGMLNSPNPPNLIMVTSSMPGEGKTYTSMNLAMSIAMEIDRTVLTIDSDILKSDLSRLFGAYNRTGLYDYLAHPDLDVSDVMCKTNVPTLSFIPAGTIREGITERLASQAMVKLVAELSHRYSDRIIIFDAPPVLAMSGAAALAPLMGQVVVVVEAYKTSRENLKRTLSALEHVQITGLVLNKMRHRASGGSYGYGGYGGYGYGGYGYGYGYGYGSQQPKT